MSRACRSLNYPARREIWTFLKKSKKRVTGGDEISFETVNNTNNPQKRTMNIDNEFEKIYHRHFRRLYEMAYRVLLDKDDALDSVHDVMVRLYTRLDDIAESPGAYLTTAMRNELADRLRRMDIETRHARWIAEDNDEALDAALQEMEERQERLASINEVAKREFTPAVSRVFDAVFRHGRSYAETAADLSISQSTVNKHVVAALKILRNYFYNRI